MRIRWNIGTQKAFTKTEVDLNENVETRTADQFVSYLLRKSIHFEGSGCDVDTVMFEPDHSGGKIRVKTSITGMTP